MKNSIDALLFDLDGTLLDTAPDLVFALNTLLIEHALPQLTLADIRPIASLGSKDMIKKGFHIDETHPDFKMLREDFLNIYQAHLADSTRFFPNMEKVLINLENANIPWGIVTNKLTRHAELLLKQIGLHHRSACIVCGDSLAKAKPNPEPILHALKILKKEPKNCLYIGDAITDVIASKAAGTKSLVALYGYIHTSDDPYSWAADGYINDPEEIMDWIAKFPKTE